MWSKILFVSLWALASSMLLGGNSSREPLVREVSCPSATGCYRLIGQTVDLAASGTTIRIGPGTYYEPPFTIDRSLTLQGAGTEATKIILTDPRAEKPTTGITILANQALTVELTGLRIENAIPVLGQGEAINAFSQTTEEMQVILRDVYLQSAIGLTGQAAQFGGLLAKGPTLTVEASTIVVDPGIAMESEHLRLRAGIAMESGRLILRDSYLYVPENAPPLPLEEGRIGLYLVPGSFLTPPPSIDSPPPVFLPVSVEAVLERNQIRGFVGAVAAAGDSFIKTSLTVQLTENDISSNTVGILLDGDQVTANFVSNEIHDNSQYGIKLTLPGCGPVSSDESSQFKGTVEGTGNRVYGNKQLDLCPVDYPWPPGFITNP